MENRNLDKLKPFIKAYNSGEIIYSGNNDYFQRSKQKKMESR